MFIADLTQVECSYICFTQSVHLIRFHLKPCKREPKAFTLRGPLERVKSYTRVEPVYSGRARKDEEGNKNKRKYIKYTHLCSMLLSNCSLYFKKMP